MWRAPLVFRTLFVVACFLVFAYPVLRLSQWLGLSISLGGALALWLVGMLGMWHSFRTPVMKTRYLVVHWMGASFIVATLTLGYELLRLMYGFDDALAARWILALALALVLGAVIASHHLQVKRIEIRSAKLSARRRVVQISDVHIGSRQGGFMARVVKRVNRLQADVVVITGDLLDSSAVEIDALRSLQDIIAPTFFSVGNHERYADLPKVITMLEALNVRPLRQQSHFEAGLQLHGIDDADSPQQVAKQLPGLDIDTDKFNILLYHRPNGWEDAIAHGVDLMLSGHTHNGQIFPFNYIVKQQFARINGYYHKNGAHLYVNAGTGTWGPLMRLGSLNEISSFELIPDDIKNCEGR